MSVLAYIESSKGKVKKNAFEIVSYSSELAKKLDTDLVALVLNCNDISELSKYGASKILKVTSSELENFNAKSYANIIAQAAKISNSNHIVLSSSLDTKYLAPLLSIELDAGYLSNVVELPSSLSPFTVKRTSFTNKAFSDSTIDSEFKIIGLSSNAFGLLENNVESSVEDFNPSLIEEKITIKSTEKISGKISIADADIVVSAGRGLKGPENWNIIEELAETLGAATACSKPVSDMGWRPHSEHVGQTGKPVATNLYIAIGISGAIQHLAGINSSKIKVVINNDPEAPFFKAADYGVVGDAFDVVPRLTEKLKAFKA
ncbi:MAG: electron transfer flavoprotein subunit alpha/FixB family protein [Bacteroidetes bacterium]|nr:MAG: electron transfer flavoprotein subunit alpha [Cryomorphaceae bacterium BACL29 MAG-121220-bin8]MDA0758469.1 electron transfer flavoprotein subunit alpha/FixB family protein [Bacteroidota bacterium]MDA1018743.1 electron transfer flavoprotein subunit alpha/FixB family protein [Bacteroidota bacterium]